MYFTLLKRNNWTDPYPTYRTLSKILYQQFGGLEEYIKADSFT